jgi:hypothetical protein
MEKGLQRILVGGGQEFYGPTAERDRRVCELLPVRLFERTALELEIVTGGTAGIPDVVAEHWPGKVLDVVSDEYETEYKAHAGTKSKRAHVLAGKSQLARRLAMTAMPGVVCAIFIQGGKYSTHEMRLLYERGVPIVPLWGGGGAAGGQPACAYEGWSLPIGVASDWNEDLLLDSNPATDPELIVRAMVRCVLYVTRQVK